MLKEFKDLYHWSHGNLIWFKCHQVDHNASKLDKALYMGQFWDDLILRTWEDDLSKVLPAELNLAAYLWLALAPASYHRCHFL